MLPEYVLKYKTKGHKIVLKNNSYQLYKTTSKRIQGMKNPQPQDIYLAIIKEEGLLKAKTRVDSITVYEYGLSMYCLKLCEDLLEEYAIKVIVKGILIFIYGVQISQEHYKNSYLSILYPNMKIDNILNVEKEVSKKIYYKVNRYEYLSLLEVSAVYLNKRWYLSNINENNTKTLEKYNIRME